MEGEGIDSSFSIPPVPAMWRCAEKASSEVSSHHTSQILHWEIHKGGKSHLASFWLGVLLTDADILCPGEGLQEVVGMLVLLR